MLTKCNATLNIIRYLCGTWWGADSSTLITLYKAYVRSSMEYGCFIYFPSQKARLKKIEQVQFAAIRAALGFRKSTPTNVLLAESKLPLLENRAKLLCKRYITKVWSNKDSLMYPYLVYHKQKFKRGRKIINECLTELSLTFACVSKQDKIPLFEYKFETSLIRIPVDFEFGSKLKKHDNPMQKIDNLLKDKQSIELYTNGSKIKGNKSVGIGCYVPETNIMISKSINKYASIFTAEAIASSEALKVVSESKERSVYIFTDSKSVLQSLNKYNTHANVNPYILQIKEFYNRFLIERPNGNIEFI